MKRRLSLFPALTGLALSTIPFGINAQTPTPTVRSTELKVERLAIDGDDVPWSYVEIAYPPEPWSEAHAAAWGRPGASLPLGNALAIATIRSGTWLEFGEDGGGISGEGDGTRPSGLGIRFRGEDDPQDQALLWLEDFEGLHAGRQIDGETYGFGLDVQHTPLDPPARLLEIRLIPGPKELPREDESEDRFYPIQFEIRWGPHLLTSDLRLTLPDPIPSRSGTRLGLEVRRAIERAKYLEFLAIGPLQGEELDDEFRGHRVTARYECTDPTVRGRLARGLTRAALMGPPWSVDCFEPQLGIRIRDPELGDYDALISASCTNMIVYRLGDDEPFGPNLDEDITWQLIEAIDQACGFVRREL